MRSIVLSKLGFHSLNRQTDGRIGQLTWKRPYAFSTLDLLQLTYTCLLHRLVGKSRSVSLQLSVLRSTTAHSALLHYPVRERMLSRTVYISENQLEIVSIIAVPGNEVLYLPIGPC
jgi:hypothetical protein